MLRMRPDAEFGRTDHGWRPQETNTSDGWPSRVLVFLLFLIKGYQFPLGPLILCQFLRSRPYLLKLNILESCQQKGGWCTSKNTCMFWSSSPMKLFLQSVLCPFIQQIVTEGLIGASQRLNTGDSVVMKKNHPYLMGHPWHYLTFGVGYFY